MASANITRNRARVAGSGFTIFSFMNQPLAFCQQVSHTSPRPVGSGAVAIHPMDEPYPVQIITPAAAGIGGMTINIFELYNAKVWDRLGAEVGATAALPLGSNQNTTNFGQSILSGAVDIADIFVRVAEQRPEDITVKKFIRPPKIAGVTGTPYHEIYHNVVITDVRDNETVEVGTMEVIKQIDIAYTHVTRPGYGENGSGRSRASVLRDAKIV